MITVSLADMVYLVNSINMTANSMRFVFLSTPVARMTKFAPITTEWRQHSKEKNWEMCGSSRRFSYFSVEGNVCRLVLNRLYSIKSSKDAELRQVLNKSTNHKLAVGVGTQGRWPRSKLRKLHHSWGNLKPEIQNFPSLQTENRRFSVSLDGLNRSLVQFAGELFWCKVTQKKRRMRDLRKFANATLPKKRNTGSVL